MTPRDVRDRFEQSGEGSWQTNLGQGDDTVLEWQSQGPRGRVSDARFEFHLGMLVAVRAHTQDRITSERATVTTKTVFVERPAERGSEIVLLARDCPTHHDEAEALVARSGRAHP